MVNVFIQINYDNLASLFLCRFEPGCNTSLAHYSFSVSKVIANRILRIFMSDAVSMRIDADAYFTKELNIALAALILLLNSFLSALWLIKRRSPNTSSNK